MYFVNDTNYFLIPHEAFSHIRDAKNYHFNSYLLQEHKQKMFEYVQQSCRPCQTHTRCFFAKIAVLQKSNVFKRNSITHAYEVFIAIATEPENISKKISWLGVIFLWFDILTTF